MSDNIKNPQHYQICSVECKDIIQIMLGSKGYLNFCKGNVLKYIFRYKHKNGLEDLQKARQYIEMAREVLPCLDDQIMEMQDLVERCSRDYKKADEGYQE